MTEQQLREILNAHADALLCGTDNTEMLLSRHRAQQDNLRPLFNVARRVQEVLVPVELNDDFVVNLGVSLRALEQEDHQTLLRRLPRSGLLGAAVVGSVLSTAGAALLVRRWLQERDEALTSPAL